MIRIAQGSRAGVAMVLLACMLHPAMAASPVGQTVADGQSAFDRGRIREAERIWTALAESGDADAAYGLGLLADLGKGAHANLKAAYAWYRRAAEAGLPAAEFNVAVMLDAGQGAPRDPAAAAIWYARAAAQGHARAQFNLAQLYTAGQGVPRNAAAAEAWYRLAARNGLRAASDRLTASRSVVLAKPDASLVAAMPAVPAGQMSTGATGAVPVDIVWLAPSEPAAVSFFIEIVAMAAGGPQEAFAGYTDVSALQVALPPARYAWRVYTVGRDMPHYTASGWTEFTVTRSSHLGG